MRTLPVTGAQGDERWASTYALKQSVSRVACSGTRIFISTRYTPPTCRALRLATLSWRHHAACEIQPLGAKRPSNFKAGFC